MLSRQLHRDRVLEHVQSNSAAACSRLAASWRRSAVQHGLDPETSNRGDRLADCELSGLRAEQDRLMAIAAPSLDRLFQLVGASGCGVLLADRDGVVLDQRFADGDVSVFRHWGLWSGAVWSEASEGTNGIGTCLVEKRSVTIHRDEHFFARNIAMSCISAPVYGPEGQLVAALDVSSARADQTAAMNQLIAATVAQTARQIESDCFSSCYADARIMVASDNGQPVLSLLAVDHDELVIGATRSARIGFGMGLDKPLKPRPVSDILETTQGPTGFERGERSAMVRALARAEGNVSAAARALGVGRATFYRRMKRLNLSETAPIVSQW